MKKMIYLLGFSLLGVQGTASASRSSREQMVIEVQVDMLEHRFGIAGNLYKVQKFQLAVPVTEKAEEVFAACIDTYKQLYATLSEAERPFFFTDDFYKHIIPVVQYFRSPEYSSMMIAHRNILHPTPEVPDPKHHDHNEEHNHN